MRSKSLPAVLPFGLPRAYMHNPPAAFGEVAQEKR